MKKKILVPVLLIMITMFFLTSCNEVEKDDVIPSTTPTTIETTVKATETTPESAEATETTETIPTKKVVFEDYELDLDVYGCHYLLQEQKAFVFDNDVSDGLLMQDEFAEVQLPEGTILVSLDSIRPGLEPYPETMLFILADGRCVFFEQDISEDGKPLYNGKLLSDLVGAQRFFNLWDEGEPKVVENYELLPNIPLDPSIAPQNIIINVDWNGDRKTDTITRECADALQPRDQTVWFTDGATGIKTDITDRFASGVGEEHGILTNSVMLFQDDKTGRYALIDSMDLLSSDYSIFVYSYDEKTIVSYTENDGIFVYEDGVMYEVYLSFFFDIGQFMKTPLVFDGKSVKTDPSVREFWFLAALKAEENSEAIPGNFTWTLKDVPVEKKTASVYEDDVIQAGIAVFPKYYMWNNNEVRDSGYLYFVLADGSEYRIAFEQEPQKWSCTFGGVPQKELFRCEWGD